MKLEGIRVIDLSRFLPGPWIGLTMADHGAEVIKIEMQEGEPTRRLGPPIKGFPAYFRKTQRGKKSVVLNLKDPEGLEIFYDLASEADVIIESFRPGVADRIGIGYDQIRARAPGIVYCALSAFGQKGPLAQNPSHDAGAQALTGILSLGQVDGREPCLPSLPVADVALGSAALIGILMALLRREKTGKGDFVDMAMTDSLISWTPHILSTVIDKGEAPDLSVERLHGGAAFYNVYRTKDNKHVVLSGAEMNFVEILLKALGRPDLIEVCRQPWGAAQQPAKDFLTATFATRTRDEWDKYLGTLGICYAPVLNMKEAWDLPVLRERGMIVRGDDGVENLGTPIHFREEPGQPSCRMAEKGADTDEILGRLGRDAQTIARLREKKVI